MNDKDEKYLKNKDQFIAFNGEKEKPNKILFKNNNQLINLNIGTGKGYSVLDLIKTFEKVNLGWFLDEYKIKCNQSLVLDSGLKLKDHLGSRECWVHKLAKLLIAELYEEQPDPFPRGKIRPVVDGSQTAESYDELSDDEMSSENMDG